MESIARLQQHGWATCWTFIIMNNKCLLKFFSENRYRLWLKRPTSQFSCPLRHTESCCLICHFGILPWCLLQSCYFFFPSKVKGQVMSQALIALKSGGTRGVAAWRTRASLIPCRFLWRCHFSGEETQKCVQTGKLNNNHGNHNNNNNNTQTQLANCLSSGLYLSSGVRPDRLSMKGQTWQDIVLKQMSNRGISLQKVKVLLCV